MAKDKETTSEKKKSEKKSSPVRLLNGSRI